MQAPTNDVLAVIAEVFEESVENLTPDRKLESIDAWDSIGILTFNAELDDKYSLMLTTEEIQTLTTVQDIISVLRERGLDIVD